MKMYFYPDSFERITESVSRSQRKCKLAVVDSFTMYMLLQFHAKGKRFAEHKTSLDVLRPSFSPTNDKRKDKDILYFLGVLRDANMITFETNRCEVSYKFVECSPTMLSTLGTLRKFVLIRECNYRIMEDYCSNVPFALYCLLHSLQRRNNGVSHSVIISHKTISKRLGISIDTVNKYKFKLEENGYIFSIRGWSAGKGVCDCNKYILFDYDGKNAERKPEKFKIFQMRRRKWKNKEQQTGKSNASDSKLPQETIDAVDWDI